LLHWREESGQKSRLLWWFVETETDTENGEEAGLALRKESKGRVSFTGLKVASNESLGRVCFAATDFHAAGVTVIFFSSA
jgi:hypothetical protein